MTNSREMYYLFDSPVPYKELLIYPIKMRDYLIFHQLASCLMLEKNSIPDIKIIQMTYLQYLFYISNKDDNLISVFDALLRLVLNKREEKFKIEYSVDDRARPLFKIGKIVYNSQDFESIREIIVEQNALTLPDEKIQKEVRDKIDESRKFRQKVHKTKMASLEEQILALSMYSGWDIEKVYSMTIRKFFMALKRANHMIMSNIYLTASMSGFVKFKDKSATRGWLSDIDDDDGNPELISLDSIKSTVSSGDVNK